MNQHQTQVEKALAGITLPAGIVIRAWAETDFPAIQQLSAAEGWPTPIYRADESLSAWLASWPTLVIMDSGEVFGFLRALTDGLVTTYIAELLIAPSWRKRHFGKALVEVCQRLFPSTRIDLLSIASSAGFYESMGFRSFYGFRKSPL